MKQETFGDVDIYQVDTRFGDNDLRVEEGYAFIESEPTRANIILTDLETGNEIGNFYSHSSTGKFILIFNPLKTYKVEVQADDCNTFVIEMKPLPIDANSHYFNFKLKKSNAQ